jgi:hypothetical protein
VFKRELELLGIEASPSLVLRGTPPIMAAALAFKAMDGGGLPPELAMQRYDPADAPGAVYSFLFELGAKDAYGRILTGADPRGMFDLVDLLDVPFPSLGCAGYMYFYVTRTDGEPLSDEDVELLEKRIQDDYAFDIPEEELQLSMSTESIPGALSVTAVELYDDEIDLSSFGRGGDDDEDDDAAVDADDSEDDSEDGAESATGNGDAQGEPDAEDAAPPR